MDFPLERPFESIEDASDYLQLLLETVAEAKGEIDADVQRQSEAASRKPGRRLDALRIAAYNLQQLDLHLSRSRRILNDLRSLRRLLFEERGAPRAQAPTPFPPASAGTRAGSRKSRHAAVA